MIVVIGFPIGLSAQHQESNLHHPPKKTRGIYEIITSRIYAYSFEHEEGVAATEIHFTYWFDHTWGGGLSYTAKFEEDEVLNDLALIGSMNPAKWMTINVGPSFALPSDHRDFHLGAYAETEINIRLRQWFHFGPILGAVLGKESEGNIGFHLGFEF